MFSAINTKLLVVIIALLASIASYFAYEKHKQEVAEKKAQELRRPFTPEQQKALPKGWANSVKDYRSK
jgi:hypothetical protein